LDEEQVVELGRVAPDGTVVLSYGSTLDKGKKPDSELGTEVGPSSPPPAQ
jgi:hypothetical protein